MVKARMKLRIINYLLLTFPLSFLLACAKTSNTGNTNPTNANTRTSTTTTTATREDILIIEDGSIIETATFDDQELAELARAGNMQSSRGPVSAKLDLIAKRCCPPRKRIDECTWHCCNNRRVKTCNPILGEALEEKFGEEQIYRMK